MEPCAQANFFWLAFLSAMMAPVFLVMAGDISIQIVLQRPFLSSPRWLHAVRLVLAMFFVGTFVLVPMAAQLSAMSLRRRIREHDGQLCLRCGYALHGLANVKKCPECGEAFSGGSNRKAWARHFPGLWGEDRPQNAD